MFELFAETIDGIPPQAMLGLLKREYETLQDALQRKRIRETPEIHSILCFCQFINTSTAADVAFETVNLPVKHADFYRKIVLRLAAAGEIPESAMARFDAIFFPDSPRNLAVT